MNSLLLKTNTLKITEESLRTAGFSAVARCTNVNTFGILPHRLSALRENEASELGFVFTENFK